MAVSECSVYSCLRVDSKVKFPAYELRSPGADRLLPR